MFCPTVITLFGGAVQLTFVVHYHVGKHTCFQSISWAIAFWIKKKGRNVHSAWKWWLSNVKQCQMSNVKQFSLWWNPLPFIHSAPLNTETVPLILWKSSTVVLSPLLLLHCDHNVVFTQCLPLWFYGQIRRSAWNQQQQQRSLLVSLDCIHYQKPKNI